MSEGKRPGGLTALAVINFVFGGFSALGVLAMVALVTLINTNAIGEDEARREMVHAWEQLGTGLFYAVLALSAVTAVLLIASGVGYLQQKKLLGRTLGTVYGVIAIASSLLMALVVTEKAGGGFHLGTLVGLVYPVLTLILLNTTFKHDFVR